MHDVTLAFPTVIIMRAAVAAVWLYEGLWSKLLGGQQRQVEVVSAVPIFGPRLGRAFLKALGVVEVALAAWVISGFRPGICAVAEISLLFVLNVNGLMWARHVIHDPAGMVLKNAAFLVLAWVCGATPGASA
jgi:hypothetical protein